MPVDTTSDKIPARIHPDPGSFARVAPARAPLASPPRMPPRKIDWTNALFIGFAHILAFAGIWYMAAVRFEWLTVGLGFLWFAFCGLGITGGYHRLFAHPTYKASWPLRLFYLLFGAASVQNSALKWSADHRQHHRKTDTSGDPYDISRGFWWAHIGWVLTENMPEEEPDMATVKDLEADPLIRWQHRYYVPLALFVGAILPALIAGLWGDAIGGFLIAGFLRLVLQWHATFSVNSFAHMIGTQPYSTKNSARDSWVTAILTLGEGYHNFHHRFQSDYRNGVRWFQLDPTKWFVWTMSKIGITSDLKRTPQKIIDRAREACRTRSTANA